MLHALYAFNFKPPERVILHHNHSVSPPQTDSSLDCSAVIYSNNPNLEVTKNINSPKPVDSSVVPKIVISPPETKKSQSSELSPIAFKDEVMIKDGLSSPILPGINGLPISPQINKSRGMPQQNASIKSLSVPLNGFLSPKNCSTPKHFLSPIQSPHVRQ